MKVKYRVLVWLAITGIFAWHIYSIVTEGHNIDVIGEASMEDLGFLVKNLILIFFEAMISYVLLLKWVLKDT